MKRSKTLTLTAAMVAGGGLTLSACGQAAQSTQTASTEWGESAASSADEGRAFRSVQECRDAGDLAASECESAYASAAAERDATAPRFADQAACEAQFGADGCEPRQQAGGGTMFMPLLAGFLIGRTLSGGYGRGFYRDPAGRAVFGNGRPLGAQAFGGGRASRGGLGVNSRGGFGGGGRGYGG